MKTVKVFELDEWNDLVQKTYGKPYNYQQQEGCMSRGTDYFDVPCDVDDLGWNDEIPEELETEEMGVKFAKWLERDPNQPIKSPYGGAYITDWWWERNFYPNIFVIFNDLHKRGLLEAGKYAINIDW